MNSVLDRFASLVLHHFRGNESWQTDCVMLRGIVLVAALAIMLVTYGWYGTLAAYNHKKERGKDKKADVSLLVKVDGVTKQEKQLLNLRC